MNQKNSGDLTRDLLLPVLLFASLGGMTWAVRGCSGFGAMNGCIFAGVTWGTAWWFIAHSPGARQSRPYNSGWIILALTIGIGISGARGWMQWPSFFEGHLQTNSSRGEFVPISRAYGFLWLFLAGVPWAGLGACMLAWCNSHPRARLQDWGLRILCGFGMAFLARVAFKHYPQIFLPLYDTIHSQYADLAHNPNLRRLIGDNRSAITHLGLYLGFLLVEIIRRDWRNTTLISTVGLVNGAGWALCQNWKWAAPLWPQWNFNWWRCWESSGGISIGVAYGIAYYLTNRPMTDKQIAQTLPNAYPNLERFGAYLGLVFGLGLSLKNGLKGWANIYIGNENYWNRVLWQIIGPAMIVVLVGLIAWILFRRLPRNYQGDVFPHAYRLMWLVLIWQNVIAQLVTGPRSNWNEMAFKLYYVLLFLVSSIIVYHFHLIKTLTCKNSVSRAGVEAEPQAVAS